MIKMGKEAKSEWMTSKYPKNNSIADVGHQMKGKIKGLLARTMANEMLRLFWAWETDEQLQEIGIFGGKG